MNTFRELSVIKLNYFYVKALEKIRVYWGAVVTVLLLIVVIAFLGDLLFGWRLTGLLAYRTTTTTPTETITTTHPGKTLWDLLDLVLLPVIVAAGVFLLSWLQYQHQEWLAAEQGRQARELAEKGREQARELAQGEAEEGVLQHYFDVMARLLLDRGLRRSKADSEVRYVARLQTLTVLKAVNDARKRQVLCFLYEAGLLDIENTVLQLQGVDLSRVDLARINLEKANLQGVNLQGANLQRANLVRAYLEGANLTGVNLQGADLEGATYDQATIWPDGFDPEAPEL